MKTLNIVLYELTPEYIETVLRTILFNLPQKHRLFASAKNLEQVRNAGLQCELFDPLHGEIDLFVTMVSGSIYSVYPDEVDISVFDRVIADERIVVVVHAGNFSNSFYNLEFDYYSKLDEAWRDIFKDYVLSAKQTGLLYHEYKPLF